VTAPSIRDFNLTQRVLMGPITDGLHEGWAKVNAHLRRLSDKQLWQLQEAVHKLGSTNCSWLVYRMRESIAEEVDIEVRERETARAAGKQEVECRAD